LKKATKVGDKIHIQFLVPSKEFANTLNQIKFISGRRWDAGNKMWIVPYKESTVDYLKNLGFEIIGVEEEKPLPFIIHNPRKKVDLSLLPSGLRPYQIEAVEFMEAVNWRGFISLAPRMGKSVVSLCGWMLHPEFAPMLIICPASVKINWQREIYKWTKKKAHIISGTQTYKLPDVRFHIINYDILADWKGSLPQFNYIIVDESHSVSNTTLTKSINGKSTRVPVQRTEAFRTIAKNTPHIALLSGTPVTSKIWQLWVGLNSLNDKAFPNEYAFKHRYCAPHHDGFGWRFDGLSNGEELYAKLSKYMYRKTREEVFTDLPEESHDFVQVELDRVAFEADLKDFREWYSKHKDVSDEDLEIKLSSFASLSYSKKRTSIIEWISNFCESDEQIVVFAWHRDVVEDLHRAFKKKSVMMYGGIDINKKQKAIDDFNAGRKQIFIANIASAKEGITLAGANTVAFVEFPHTPGDLEQSSQRIWLPGKQNKLNYVYFCAVDLEEKRIDKLRERAKILSRALDGKETEIMVDRVREYLEEL